MPVTVDHSRDANLTDFGLATLRDRYLLPGEQPQDLFARVANAYGEDDSHAQRLYDYMSQLWFMPSTPILSNGGTKRGLPISCFLNEVQDDLTDIAAVQTENTFLAARGGGIGTYWSNLRSLGERVGQVGKTSGIMPFLKVMDSQTLAVSQGSLRRGSAATYLRVDHPEILEFLEMRRPTGGDPNRKCLNLHHGVVIPDAFMRAVESDAPWDLVSPHTGETIETVDARDLWIRVLTTRVETGEPYLLFIDKVNRHNPMHLKQKGLDVKTSNLCSEITLPTTAERTAVCCLASLNIEKYDEWAGNFQFVHDVMLMLDNVLEDFIQKADPKTHARAIRSARNERSVGLGVMGLHSYFQSKMVPMTGGIAAEYNRGIFYDIHRLVDYADKEIMKLRGPCPDSRGTQWECRFSNKTAIAPTASISIICGGSSPGIEPVLGNAFTHKTLSGSFSVKNKHLMRLLEEKGQNTPSVWTSIFAKEGSVQHLEFLTDDEKAVFETAREMDQLTLVEMNAVRQQYVDQAISFNVFVPGNVSKAYLHRLHYWGWKQGLKSFYYCRSSSVGRAETISDKVQRQVIPEFEECEVCQ